MIYLRTLGALDLRSSDGTELRSVLAQPKRLALLTYLAVATPFGYHRRDTLLGLFWPDLDQHHARNALSRAVYYLRRALSEEAIVGRGDDELRLSEERVECDARAFEVALDARLAEQALSLYHGDLLEGFFLTHAPEFERWLEDRRTALRSRAVEGAWTLAQANDGASSVAEHWARRAVALSPYDGEGLTRLMRLLDQRGARGQALVAYEQFARRLSADLGVEPSHQTKALVDSWRRETSGRSIARQAAGEQIRLDPVQAAVPDERPVPPRPRFQWTSRRRVTLAVAVVAGCIWIVGATPPGLSSAARDPGVPTTVSVAVLPFSVHAQASAHEFLREGMVDLLSTKLNSAVGLRSVDPTVLLAAPSLRTPHLVSPSEGRTLGERFGAGLYVLGSVVTVGDRLHIAASLYEVRGDTLPAARATVSGRPDDLFALVDQLTTDLISEIGGPSERVARVASITTQSPAALRSYLEGEQAFRQASFAPLVRFTKPIEAFRDAIALDSTFALAYYRLALAASWADSLELARWAATRATRYSGRLPAHYRLLAEGLNAFLDGNARQAISAYRAAVAAHPNDAEAWFRIGLTTALYGPFFGRPSSDLWDPFTKAARYDVQAREPWIFLAYLAAQDGDRRSVDTLIRRGYPEGVPAYWQALTASSWPDANRARQGLARIERAEPWEQTLGAILVTRYLNDANIGRRLSRGAATAAKGSDWHAQALFWTSQIELAGGRPQATKQALAEMAVDDPRWAADFRALVATWPVYPPSRPNVQAARAALRTVQSQPLRARPLWGKPSREGSEAIRLYLLGLLSAHLGERDSAVQYARMLDRLVQAPTMGSLAKDLALCLRAEVRASLDGAPADALTLSLTLRYHIPPDVLRSHPALSHLFARQRFLQAQWSRSIGRPNEALQWYASLGQVDHLFDLPFLGPAILMTARIHEETGEFEKARAEYAHFVTLWRDAEPELRPLVDNARARLARLSR